MHEIRNAIFTEVDLLYLKISTIKSNKTQKVE